ncbi:hypothetical protein CAPTEDRAFT_220329 [Capitella teleta]|uniref:Huntingtin n=1 Tax=Capitella teleta TaxID=283909 RepID=R7TWG0_CAPTE|nr:hypothetical protein CAPTEDRAFT_220329 [Capitella teleta]|eukprot:ELT98253.1 hypothetical protein CAPTEDRAFT_220329 [Capitella teleta]
MAGLEKLVKAFEALKIFQPGITGEETSAKMFGDFRRKDQAPLSKKEKIANCNTVAECICAQNLRPYVVNLLPCLARICRRPEESLQETLVVAMAKMAPVLLGFTNDPETKVLLKAFLPNIRASSAAMRRTAASSLTLICQNSRKPPVFAEWLLQGLLDHLMPLEAERDVHGILGALLALRTAFPMLASFVDEPTHGAKNNLGQKPKEADVTISSEQLLQMYELLLHYSGHSDHNVVTASLETLHVLLKQAPRSLLNILLHKGTIKSTSIFGKDNDSRGHHRLPSLGDVSALEAELSPEEEEDVAADDSVIEHLEKADNHTELAEEALEGNDLVDQAIMEEVNFDRAEDPPLEAMARSLTGDDAEYTSMEIGCVVPDKSTMSQSSSMDTLSEVPQSTLEDSSLKQVASAAVMPSDDPSPVADVDAKDPLRQGNIGSFDDGEVPLVYCVRWLCSRFLFTGFPRGLTLDRHVRVSVKALALNCVGCAVAVCPSVFLMKLQLEQPDLGSELQDVSDVLLYASHLDPQLKGNTAQIVGNLIQAVLQQSRGHFHRWVASNSDQGSLTLDDLVSLLIAILEDDSAVASRCALLSFRGCFSEILHSSQSHLALKIMLSVVAVRENPYWLVKVALLDLLAEVDYRVLHYVEMTNPEFARGQHNFIGNLSIQEHVIQDVLLSLLADPDTRVRSTAAKALVKLLPQLFYSVDNALHDPVIRCARDQAAGHFEPMLHEWSGPLQPLIHGLVKPYHTPSALPPNPVLEAALSRMVSLLVHTLMQSDSKHLSAGCCRALCELSEAFPVTLYAVSWGCAALSSHANKSASLPRSTKPSWSVGSGGSHVPWEELPSGSAGGPLPIILAILTSSPLAFDFAAHQDALQFAGNLFSGAAYKCLRSTEEAPPEQAEEQHWSCLSDRLLVPQAEALLTHLARMLNLCAHVVDEVSPGPPQSKPSLPSLPNAPSLSPIKRKAKGAKDEPAAAQLSAAPAAAAPQLQKPSKDSATEKNKKDSLGAFHHMPHYMHLYDMLKGAYSNYKISLDLSNSEKFHCLLKTTLMVLSQLLEVACLPSIARHTEDLLSCLQSSLTREPTASVLCVQQLLKALFGTNLASQWAPSQSLLSSRKPGKATRLTSAMKPGLYHSCITTPYTQFTHCLASATFRSHGDQDDSFSLLSWLRKRAEKKIPAILKPGSKTDKTAVASYIRLFEPLVIRALKQYTVTSCLSLQQQVLNLLAQLVQLRVNYCLLDSDQIFIGFVIKQFEFIEEGQIRNSEVLIPAIFHFLVLLSYERYHSKSIIGMPKVIQLCDGIMASGLDPTLHALPALQCIVHDLFALRGATHKSDLGRDLETQREVVVSMLLRVVQHPQVLELLIIVLHQCRKESEDKWKRLSRQVTDMVLPLLTRQMIDLGCQEALDVVHRLFETVATSVFRPVDVLLKSLFSAPSALSSVHSLQQWLCLVLVVLRVIIAQSKEEVVLGRLQELGLGLTVLASNPTEPAEEKLATTGVVGATPEETIARFLLQVIGITAVELNSRLADLATTSSEREKCDFLAQELGHLLLYVTHMFQSGIYRRVATTAMKLIQKETGCHFLSVQQINSAFKELSWKQPTLSLQWCNVLILLNYEDANWWGSVMQTPHKYKMSSSPSLSNYNAAESFSPVSQKSINKEVLRRGGLIVFCDYICENLSDAEHMTSVIINHVNDLIDLSHEPPVQDFISAIHRNSAASGLFIQAIHSRCDNFSKPVLAKKTLQCLEAIHLSQSGAVLTLLIDKFLHSHHLTVARYCDSIACRRVEMLLSETSSVHETCAQLPLEDLEKLLKFMKLHGLLRRHARLASLLNKLRNNVCPESLLTLSPEKTHPLALANSNTAELSLNKEWFLSIVRDQCFTAQSSQRECAELLQHLDYSNILSIIMAKECKLSVLEECIALGSQRSLHQHALTLEGGALEGTSPTHMQSLDPLFRAAQITMFRHINGIINLLPVPHQVLSFDVNVSSEQEQYNEKIDDHMSDATWADDTQQLAAALLRYLVVLPEFPWKPEIPEESLRDIGRFSILSLELIHWQLRHSVIPSPQQLQTAVECLGVILRHPKLNSLFGQIEQSTWVCVAIAAVHQILLSLLVLPGSRLVKLPNQDSQDEMPNASFDGLARMPLVNSYARTPPLVWKMGWMPSPLGELKTRLPPLPLEYLQEKDVLREFIFRINILGWTSRQQFEETWMSLLGVLNPVSTLSEEELHLSPEEDIDRTQCAVLALRCISALIVHSTLSPHSGDPSSSLPEKHPRDKPIAFLLTRAGKKLAKVRGRVEKEMRYLCHQRTDLDSHHWYSQSQQNDLLVQNMDVEPGGTEFGLGQISIESIWSLVGMLKPNQLLRDPSTESTEAAPSSDDPPSLPPPVVHPPPARMTSPTEVKERSSKVSGLDIHSCLQFLLELYGTILSPGSSPRIPLMQLNEALKSVIALSDMFTERQQYEWLLVTLLDLQRSHPAEDELLLQHLIVGACKAGAVIGMDAGTGERVLRLMELSLRSTHLPTKVAGLFASIYLMEAGSADLMPEVVTSLTHSLTKTLGSITQLHTTIHSQQHVLVMWTVTFYLLENHFDFVKDVEFLPRVMQLAMTTVSASEEATPLLIYLAVMRGLERLLLIGILPKTDIESLIKLSMDRYDRLCLPSPCRSLAGLGLMLTCMYSGRLTEQWLLNEDGSDVDALDRDPEGLIVAMERVTLLFDRARKGFPYEARVITSLLPTFLTDFFPPNDIMNKVIGEFLSNQQPHPQLMARVVFHVFEQLLERRQIALVQDWVMLSLSNFTQRTPVAMAIWSLTCFFISASSNPWLRSLLVHVLGRIGHMDSVDRKIFVISALEFRSQLENEAQQRSFVSTFQNVASLDAAYSDLLSSCNSTIN